MIEIKYQVDFADYIRLMFQIAYRRWTYIIITLLGVIQLPLIAAMFIIPSLYNPNSLTSSIMLIIFAFMMPMLLYFRTRAYYFGNHALQQETRAAFNSDCIEFTGKKMQQVRLNWERIRRVQETNDWIIFYQTKYFFNFVPKSAFKTSGEIEKLRKIIRNKTHIAFR